VFVSRSNRTALHSARTHAFPASSDSSSGTTRSAGSVPDEPRTAYAVNTCALGGDCDCDDVIAVVVRSLARVRACVVLGVSNAFAPRPIVTRIRNDSRARRRCDE
jgi:hypothetical protein